MPRHAKAGNLNNALLATDGEFLLILDADQMPEPAILDRTLGYFPTRRSRSCRRRSGSSTCPTHDPLGSQAPLFYGPIQQGKDGWNAAFFCGSNAVLRREALMQLGIVGLRRARSSGRSAVRCATAGQRAAPRPAREANGPDRRCVAGARPGRAAVGATPAPRLARR